MEFIGQTIQVIGEITYQLVFYAQAYSSKMMKKEAHEEASDKFRVSAARLQTYYNAIAWMCLAIMFVLLFLGAWMIHTALF